MGGMGFCVPQTAQRPFCTAPEGLAAWQGDRACSRQFVDLESNQIALTLRLSNLRQMAGGHCVLSLASRVCCVFW